MPALLLLAHGFPPQELAGTERYTQSVAQGMHARGWRVSVICATRSPAHTHAQVLSEQRSHGPVHRVVNNLPWRPLSDAEHNPLVAGRVRALMRQTPHDLVHINHLLFLSPKLRIQAPTLLTLHDAWFWCARGGSLLRNGAQPCPGPEPSACAPCYADFAKGSRREHGLASLAGKLGQVVEPERLMRLWKRLPAPLRASVRRGPPSPTTDQDAAARNRALATAWRGIDRVLSPSRFLAELAQQQGLLGALHLPHGVALQPPSHGARSGLLFLGTLAPHKGPDLVVRAWELLKRAPLPMDVGLSLVGPKGDPSFCAGLPRELVHPPLPSDQIPALMAGAQALVLGSIWPENAPLVILEARAAGTPIVAPRIGGIPELVLEGVDGFLYRPGDAGDCARAMHAALTQPTQVRPPWDFQQHLDALAEHYESLLV